MAFMMGSRQKQAVRMLFEGERVGDIAAAVGVHRSTLWRWFRRPEMQRYAQGYFARRTRQLLGSHARRRMIDPLDSPDPREALAAAERVLDALGDWLWQG